CGALDLGLRAQPALRIAGNVRLRAGPKMNLQHSVGVPQGRGDRRRAMIDEHEGPLQCLRVTSPRTCAIVPQPQGMEAAGMTVVQSKSEPLGVVLHPCELMCGLEAPQVRQQSLAARQSLYAHLQQPPPV